MSGEKPAGLVTSDAVTASARLRKRIILIVLVLLGLVVVGAGAWLVMRSGLLKLGTPTAKQDLNNLSPSAAIKAAQDEVAAATTAGERAKAYLDLGQSYLRNNQTDQAITAYQKALSNSTPNSGGSGAGSGSGSDLDTQLAALAQLGSAYNTNGNIQQTIDAFEKIIAILKQSGDPTLEDQIPKYQTAIDNLKTEGHL